MGMSSLTGGGGLSSSSSAQSGQAQGQSGSGNKSFVFGGNPNSGATNAIASTLTNPFVIVGVVVVVLLWKKKR